MPTPGPAGNLEIVLHWYLGANADAALNVLHAHTTEVVDGDLALIVADVIGDAFDTEEVGGCLAIGWFLDHISIRLVTEMLGPWIAPTNKAGTDNSNSLPNQVALVTTFQTGQGGRTGRGRAYFPPVSEGDSVGVNASSECVSHVEDFWTTIRTQLAAANIIQSVWSRKDEALYDITSNVTHAVYGSQRRRQERFYSV